MASKKEYVVGFLTYGAEPHLMVALRMMNTPNQTQMMGRWNGVGGEVAQAGQSREDEGRLDSWMVKEFKAATGVATVAGDWLVKASLEWPNGPTVHVLHAHRESWIELPEWRAEEPVRWCRVDSLPPYCLPDVRWLLPLCLDDRVRFPVRVFMLPQEPATVAGEGEGK